MCCWPLWNPTLSLPHQIHALSRAISGDRVRYLLADEVGLGKTIEAGLVMRELKLRGLLRRTLVVSPKDIATQWVAEMQTYFNEQFQPVLGDDISTLQRLAPGVDHRSSAWSMFDQVIGSLDSVKPMDKRPGYVSVFLSEEGKLFLPTARHIWDSLQTSESQVQANLGRDESFAAHARLQEAAEQVGQELIDALQQAHLTSVLRKEERGIVSFASRHKAIERVGLPEVRQFRLSRCDADESEWRHELQSARQIVPEIWPLLMLRIIKGLSREALNE